MEAVARTIEGEAAAKMARILLVAPPARGGLATHVISLLAGLERDGYRVGVACEPEGPIARAAQERTLPVCEIGIAPEGGPARAALAAVRLARGIGEQRPQIVHTHSFGAGVVGALAMRLAPAGRLVATIHNYPPGAEGMRVRGRRHRWALGLLCRRASRLITVSEALRRDLLEVRPKVEGKCATIPNGVDTRAAPRRDPAETRSVLGLPAEGPLVGMVARLAPRKGVQDFIRAARAAADGFPSAHFALAGEGPLREEAEALCRELGLRDRVHLLGEVGEARDLIAALDMLVIAAAPEGSSIAAMEAMALGKPVVGSAAGGVPELVIHDETGLLVRPRAPDALARAILSLLRQPERAQEMGDRGRRRAAAHFDVRQMLERTKAVYADLVRQEIESGGDER